MKILLTSQYYNPIKGAAAKRTGKMAQFLSEAGHQVTVLTGFPSYPTGVLDKKYKGKLWSWEKDSQIRILHTYEFPAGTQDSIKKRLFNMLTFTKSSAIVTLLMKPFDAVIVSSPPFLSGITGLWAARSKKTKYFFDIRDLWPDSAIELGVIPKTGFITNQMKKLEQKFYKRANKIFTATPGIKNHLIKENIPDEKIEVILNSVDTNVFKPDQANFKSFDYNNDDFICGFIGNHSRVYDLETVVKTAEILKNEEKIKFLFIGEGEDKEKLKKLAENLPNVRFENEKKLNDLAPLINCFSLGLSPIADIGVSQESFPSKISEYFACGKPVIASISGDMRKIIEDNTAGLIYKPGDASGLAELILKLYNNPELTQKMAINSRKIALEIFSDKTFKDKLLKALS